MREEEVNSFGKGEMERLCLQNEPDEVGEGVQHAGDLEVVNEARTHRGDDNRLDHFVCEASAHVGVTLAQRRLIHLQDA